MGGKNYQKRVVYDIAIPTLGDTPYFLMFCPSKLGQTGPGCQAEDVRDPKRRKTAPGAGLHGSAWTVIDMVNGNFIELDRILEVPDFVTSRCGICHRDTS